MSVREYINIPGMENWREILIFSVFYARRECLSSVNEIKDVIDQGVYTFTGRALIAARRRNVTARKRRRHGNRNHRYRTTDVDGGYITCRQT